MANSTDTATEIHPEVLYWLPELKRRSGLGDWAFRKARHNGLKVQYLSNRAYVLGKDFIEYVAKAASDSRP